MRVLIGCERSGVVRDAFIRAGHDAWSCDLEPTDAPGPHLRCDIFNALEPDRWELVILHPPCTALCVAGNATYAGSKERRRAVSWTRCLFNAATNAAPRVAMENPVGVLSSQWRKPDQYIQPWQYGHGETKKTGLWLHHLPCLQPTDIVSGREPRVHFMSPSPDRARLRGITYQGIADAMAAQWS